MKVRASVMLAAALAACPLSHASANVIGYTFEALNGDGSAQNILSVDPMVAKGSFNANSGVSQQSNAKSRFGSESGLIGGASANMTMYANFVSTPTLTVMGQVNLDSAVLSDERVLICNNTNNASDLMNAAGQYRLAMNTSTGKFYVDIYDNSAPGSVDHLESSEGVISQGNWQHLAMTFDHGVVALYVDGGVVASHDYSASLTSISNSAYALVGNADWGARPLQGYLDDYYFNDEAAFSAEQVAYYSTHSITGLVPEPASMGLLAAGGLLMVRRRRK